MLQSTSVVGRAQVCAELLSERADLEHKHAQLLDKLLQSQMEAPRRGEGLADAFDIDGF